MSRVLIVQLWVLLISSLLNTNEFYVCWLLGFPYCPSHPFEWPWVTSVFNEHQPSWQLWRIKERRGPKHIQTARPWYLRHALQVAPCPPAVPGQSRSSLTSQRGKACELHLAADVTTLTGWKAGQGLPMGSQWGNKGSFPPLVSLSLLSRTGVSPDVGHKARVSSNESLHRKLETGCDTPCLPFALPPLHPSSAPRPALGLRLGQAACPRPTSVLSLPFIFFFLIP